MARFVRNLHVDRDPVEVFDAIADFAMTGIWDPGIKAARPLDDPAVGHGARFEVEAKVGPLTPKLLYMTTTYERPRHVVLEVDSVFARGRDDITVTVGADGGADIRWDAEFALKSVGRLVNPLLAVGFRRVVDSAVDGLQHWLAAGGTAMHAPGEPGEPV
jgi:hypothetical protein